MLELHYHRCHHFTGLQAQPALQPLKFWDIQFSSSNFRDPENTISHFTNSWDKNTTLGIVIMTELQPCAVRAWFWNPDFYCFNNLKSYFLRLTCEIVGCPCDFFCNRTSNTDYVIYSFLVYLLKHSIKRMCCQRLLVITGSSSTDFHIVLFEKNPLFRDQTRKKWLVFLNETSVCTWEQWLCELLQRAEQHKRAV